MIHTRSAQRYGVVGNNRTPWGYAVIDADETCFVEVDRYKSRCAAEYAARLLNRGLATINHHNVVGCRVEQVR